MLLSYSSAVYGEEAKLASREQKKTYSTKEAWQASAGGIVLHYGDGFLDADIAAEGYSEQGFNCIALPGGPDGQVDVIVGKSVPLRYTQDDLDSGKVGAHAMRFYRDRIGEPSKPTQTEQEAKDKLVSKKQELRPLSRRDALLASSDLGVVLHYGEGIYFADLAAADLVESNNMDAVARSGGKPNQIELFVNRKIKGTYTQDDLNSGRLSSLAVRFHDKEFVKMQNKKREKKPQND